MWYLVEGRCFSCIGVWFAAEQMQYSFLVGESIGLWTTVQIKSPLVPSHQIVDDDFTARFTGGPSFVILAQPPEDVDDSSLKHLIVILCHCSNVLRIFSSLTSGKLSYSSDRNHIAQACASINDSISERCIRSRQISRSRLRVMAFIAVSGFSISQKP